jgi:hypothetical protein
LLVLRRWIGYVALNGSALGRIVPGSDQFEQARSETIGAVQNTDDVRWVVKAS